MKDQICMNCGKRVDGTFARNYGICPSLSGCGSSNLRPVNHFDDLKPWQMAEKLFDLEERLSDLESNVIDAEETRLRQEAGIRW